MDILVKTSITISVCLGLLLSKVIWVLD